MKHTTELTIPTEQFDDATRHLHERKPFEGADDDACVYAWTAAFNENIEADIKVCNAPEGPWTEGVLFERGKNGIFHELACTEVDEALLGKWYWYVGEDEYMVNVRG